MKEWVSTFSILALQTPELFSSDLKAYHNRDEKIATFDHKEKILLESLLRTRTMSEK